MGTIILRMGIKIMAMGTITTEDGNQDKAMKTMNTDGQEDEDNGRTIILRMRIKKMEVMVRKEQKQLRF